MSEKFNVLEHELVPKHVVLSDKEKKEVLEKYGIEPEQLPKIFASDPAAAQIDAQPGQIVKIIRESRTAEEAVTYRLVIETEKTRIKSTKKKIRKARKARKKQAKKKKKEKKKSSKKTKKSKKSKGKKKKKK